MGKKYKAIDLFAGCGGLSSGFIKGGFQIISAVEIDNQIAATLQNNHPGTLVFQKDIGEVASKDLLSDHSNVDVIAGGPPCQGFSMSGKRIRDNGKFLNDPRNYLFREFFRVVKDLQPKVFIIENVPGILNIQGGAIRENILEIFNNIGYQTSFKVLLASEYGVPQNRRRAYFIGNNLGIDSKDLFPEKTHGNGLESFVTIEDAIFDLPFIKHGKGTFKTTYTKDPISDYQSYLRKGSQFLYNHVSSLHDENTLKILSLIKEGKGMKDLPEEFHTKSRHSGAYGRMLRNYPAYTITTRFDTPSVGRVTHPLINRSITPREAARIQSFHDSFIFYGSKSSIGKQIGNAIPPLLAYKISKKILKLLDNKF